MPAPYYALRPMGRKPQLLLGDVHYGYAPPVITGPHELVRVPGMGNDHMAVDTSNAEAQQWSAALFP